MAWRQAQAEALLPLLKRGLALAAAAGLLVGCTDRAPKAAAPQAPHRVSALGRIEPEDKIRRVSASSALSGDRLERILVRENQWVQRGQPLAILNSQGSLKASLQAAEGLVALQRQRLAQVQAGANAGEIRSQNHQLSRLERQLAGERHSQDQIVASRRSRMEAARNEAQRYEQLFGSGAVSQLQRDRHRSRALSSQAELREAIASRQASLQRLQAEIASARETLAQLRERRPEDGAAARSELRRAIAVRDRARQELAFATVRAPQPGRILRIVSRPGDKVGQGSLLEMADTRRMIVIAEIDQTAAARLRPGLGATISVEGSQGSQGQGSLRASVYQVLPQLQRQSGVAGQPGHQDQGVFEVKLRLQPKGHQRERLASAANLRVKVSFDAAAGGAARP